MALITAERTAHYRKLANDADAAITRGDDMGVELLRALIPELTDAVEEINDGLRDVVELLFEGLRDEAIGLHDSALPEVAVRLHLADKPHWPAMALQCQMAQIALPPAIDFESLAALNAAFAEAHALGKPIGKLRRLVLEQAPLAERMSLLREICKIDPVKPVWSEQLKALEQARLAELRTEVSAAAKAADPERLAACEAELASPGWHSPAPTTLIRQVQGAGEWLRLRRGVQEISNLTPALEREFATVKGDVESLTDPERLDRLRELRNRWVRLEAECRELVFSLPQHPVVGPLATPENLGPTLELARGRVEPVLHWLAVIDADSQLVDTFRQRCAELRSLADNPAPARSSRAWRTSVAACEATLAQIHGATPGLVVPSDLIDRITAAKMIVKRREWLRLSLITALVVIPVVAVLGLTIRVVSGIRSRQMRAADTRRLEELEELADGYAVGDVLERAREAARLWPHDDKVNELWVSIESKVTAEEQRRRDFDEIIGRAQDAVSALKAAVEARRASPEAALDEWPGEFTALERAARDARKKGGIPRLRLTVGGSALPKTAPTERPEGLPREATDRLLFEERSLDSVVQELDRIKVDLSPLRGSRSSDGLP